MADDYSAVAEPVADTPKSASADYSAVAEPVSAPASGSSAGYREVAQPVSEEEPTETISAAPDPSWWEKEKQEHPWLSKLFESPIPQGTLSPAYRDPEVKPSYSDIPERLVKDVVGGAISPGGLAAITTGAAAGPVVGRIISGGFAGTMGYGLVKSAPGVYRVVTSPESTGPEKALAASEFGVNALMTGMTGAHAAFGEAGAEEVQQPQVREEPAPSSEPTPEKPVEPNPEELKPLPENAKVTVMEMGGKKATQVDIPDPENPEGRPVFSGSPEDALKAGYDVNHLYEGVAEPVSDEEVTSGVGQKIADYTRYQEIQQQMKSMQSAGTHINADKTELTPEFASLLKEQEEIKNRNEEEPGMPPSAPVTAGATEVGLGAASPKEFEPIGPSITSTQNLYTDMERAARGLDPAMEPERMKDPAVWDEAMRRIDQNPNVGEDLVNDINAKPRPIDHIENDILRHRQIDLQNQFDKVNERINSGTGSEVTLDSDKARRDELSQQLQDTYDAANKTGTELGRGLRARQKLGNEDFSLARMETIRRAANDGSPLTDKQRAENEAQHEKITETQQALDEARIAADQKTSQDQAGTELEKMTARISKEGKGYGTPPDLQTITDKLKTRADDESGPRGIQPVIRQIAEHFVRSGITEREPLIDAVHGIVKEIIPEMSRRDTMDAISGYGDFKPLNPDEIKAKLRDLKGQMQQVAKIEDYSNSEKLKKSGVEQRTPTAEELRLKNQLGQLVKMDQVPSRRFQTPGEKIPTDPYKGKVIPREYPASQEDAEGRAIANAKTRLRNQIADYQDRLKNSDFGPRPKPSPVTETPEIAKLRADSERAKQAFQDSLYKDKQANRSIGQKIWDGFVNLRRIGLISGMKTFGKIAVAGEGRIGMTGAESAIGEGLRRVPGISDIAEGAPRQGGTTGKTLENTVKGYVEGWHYALQQAVNVLKTGKTDAEINAGQRAYPPSILHYLANTHALLKLPAFAQEYKISLRERTAWEMQHGTDMTNPVNQLRVNNEAVNDGLRAKFQNDNILTKRLNMLYNSLRNSNEHPTTARAIEGIMRFAMPIVHIPTNYFVESATYNNLGLGLPRAAIKTMQAISEGVDKLSASEKDSIMRHWKKGALGAGIMLAGFYNRKNVGGYYQPGKQPPGSPEFGGMKIGGVDIPRWMIHLPIFEPYHFGATVGHVMDHITHKTGEEGTLGDGVMAGVAGLLDEMPYVSNARNITEALAPGAQGKYARGELAKSATVPQIVSDIAQMTDKSASGQPIKRAPKTVIQHVETGIPGARELVPAKRGK